MANFEQELIQRLNGLLAEVPIFAPPQSHEYDLNPSLHTQFHSFRSRALSSLVRAFGKDHHLTHDFGKRVQIPRYSHIQIGVGILEAARDDLAAGWLTTLRTLVSAEVFSDFLEMAAHLLAEKYKDAAAVIAGSTLEEHLRGLATNRNIPIEAGTPPKPRKADTLNADLAKASAYTLLDQKSITAWLDLRNNAAHGHYAKYTQEQVQLMLEGVRNFITRVPQ